MKGPLKDPADPGSYRAIAGSSIILKLFDKVVLLLWGHLLCTDPLQFGYKVKTSTTQCSWLVQEVANHFLQLGSHPIITLLDCSKAFDTCQFSKLFTRLIERGMPAIIVRVIIFVYEEQYAWVKWGRAKSSIFIIVNGTRQGSILSPALFALYVDELLVELRTLGIGCHVAGVYMGAVGFCDDLLLLAPTRDGMQIMINTCERFAKKYNLQFSTDPDPNKSKSKCIFVCGLNRKKEKPVPLVLNGKELPWVESALHLGHVFHESGSMEHDTKAKRAAFIGESTECRESFGFASPCDVLKAVKVHSGSHYGSNLWQLDSPMTEQYYSAWRTCVKLAWQVPRSANTYFVDHLLANGLTSVKTDIMSRYTKFVDGLHSSPSMEVRVMFGVAAGDVRTTTGRNIRFLVRETGLDPLCSSSVLVKKVLAGKVASVPDRDKWRIKYLARMLEERGQAYYEGEDCKQLTVLIDSLCTS